MLKHRVPDSKTVPEIFINGILYGGSDDLHRLEENGQLNFLLSQSPRQAAAKPYVACNIFKISLDLLSEH